MPSVLADTAGDGGVATPKTEMKVTIYTGKDCPNCRRLKKILESNGVEFEEIQADISDLITNYNVFSVPTIKIDGMVFGYSTG